MQLSRFVPFLQLTIANFNIECLIFIGDKSTITSLVDVVEQRLPMLPSIVFCISPEMRRKKSRMCPHCPTRQLTILHLANENLDLIRMILSLEYVDTNRIVLLNNNLDYSHDYVENFALFNMVLVRDDKNGNIEVIAWGQTIYPKTPQIMSTFKGYESIYSSNNTEALLFRKKLKRWPAQPPVNALFMSAMMAPYSFTARDETSSSLLLVSSSMTLFQIIGDALHFTVNIMFRGSCNCSECFKPLQLRNYRGFVQLFDYDQRVKTHS